MTLTEFKLAAISEEFSDAEVKRLFEDLEIPDRETLIETFEILQRHRPRLLKSIELKCFSGPKLTA